MEVLKENYVDNKIDEVDILRNLRELSTQILINREMLLDYTINEKLRENYLLKQIKDRKKFKSILIEMLKKMEREDAYVNSNRRKR